MVYSRHHSAQKRGENATLLVADEVVYYGSLDGNLYAVHVAF